MKKNMSACAGFTLFELMMVVMIIGILLGLALPRALRTQYEAKFSLLRQTASEAGAYVTMYAQNQAGALNREGVALTPGDILLGSMDSGSGTGWSGLAFHYTGHPVFDGVQARVSAASPMVNPFSKTGIFESDNDDEKTPADRPGLIYLAGAQPEPAFGTGTRCSTDFYFIFTGDNGWYQEYRPDDPKSLGKGIYIGRYTTARIPKLSTQ